MSDANKTLGKFELVGIPPAPRGVPQIEVTFDIDANGIVHVSAKDLGTGKEQSIKITASSGLTDEEIQNMVKEAEAHAEEDKQRRESAEARNQLDGLIYSTEKSMKEHGEGLDPEERGKIDSALAQARQVLDGDSTPEQMKQEAEKLSEAAHELAKKMYESATAQDQAGQTNGAAQDGASAENEGSDGPPPGAGGGSDEDVVDADFEEVK